MSPYTLFCEGTDVVVAQQSTIFADVAIAWPNEDQVRPWGVGSNSSGKRPELGWEKAFGERKDRPLEFPAVIRLLALLQLAGRFSWPLTVVLVVVFVLHQKR